MPQPTDFDITETMLTFGGSFIHALAQTWRCADEVNQHRIEQAFSDYWETYRDLTLLRAQQARVQRLAHGD